MLNQALLGRASVIHSHPLTGPQRGCHDFAGAIDDASGGPEREAHRTFLAFDHDCLPGFVSRHGARRISCRGFRHCRPGSRVCFGCFGRCRACLRECQRRNQRTSQTNSHSFHVFPSFFLVIASSTLISCEIFEVIVNTRVWSTRRPNYKESPPVLGRPATLIRKSVFPNCLIFSSYVAQRLFWPAGPPAG